ncbi:MAG: energy-coupling factor transporter ATPase [Erysipelotrichaceae bacterium]|nr:energy-coupling factor transporter ATPase [Erysipelotrichaceae bacterium]
MAEAFIKIENLSFSYESDNDSKVIPAVDNVSLEISKGEYVAVLGHNGSGKSTLAKLIVGLLEPKKGEILIEGLKMEEKNLPQIRNKIGIVFQNPDNQFIGSTVRDDIAFGLENHKVPTEQMNGIIEEYAALVRMQDFLNSEPEHLSGGQKQRVAIAGVLAMKPDIIVFDEATSMLDPVGKEELKRMIRSFHGNEDLTIISITHDIEEACFSDECIVLNEGRIVLEGKPEEVFAKADLMRKIGLDIPFSYYVKNLFKSRGITVHGDTAEAIAEELWQLHSKR